MIYNKESPLGVKDKETDLLAVRSLRTELKAKHINTLL